MAGIGGIGTGGLSAAQVAQESGIVRLKADGPKGDTSFADTLKSALGEVQQLQDESKDIIGQFVRGEPVEIHEVMTAAEEAGLALDMLIEIRNKLADAYRSVMQMQS